MTEKPNIILIMADQLGAATLNCYGSGVDSTPTLDSMAKDGTRFDRCYATSPLCAPNRATFLTGRSPEIHGVISNNYALSTDMPTYAHVLKRQGYRTSGFGKFHQTPMQKEVPDDLKFLGFDEGMVTEDPKWSPYLGWVKQNSPENYEKALSMVWGHGQRDIDQKTLDSVRNAKEKYMKPAKEDSGWEYMYTSPLPSKYHDSTYITDMGLDLVKRHVNQNKGKPFFCHISYVDPHDPYDPPKPYDTMYDPEDMPDIIPQEWDKKEFPTLYEGNSRLAFEAVANDTKLVKKLHALFHGSLKHMDDQISRVLRFVKDNNLLDNTIIIFTTDHGEMLGDHGMITKGVKHYDVGIRCPLIVYGGPVKEQETDKLTCTLDFFPTICNWAGTPEEDMPPVEGKSFADLCTTGENCEGWKEVAVSIEYGQTVSVITDDGWRLTRFNDEEKGQMFDLNQDPEEQNNLYKNSQYNEKRQELLEKLIKVIKRPHGIPQYRNLPLYYGVKYGRDLTGNPFGTSVIMHYKNTFSSCALKEE